MHSGKAQTPPLPGSPGHRLRRDALRILARNLERTTLSSAEAENLLAGHATLEASLRAVRRRRTHGSLKLRLQAYLVPAIVFRPIGIRQLRWLVSAVAVSELFLIGVFTFQSGFSIHSWRLFLQLDPLSAVYLIASILALIALGSWRWKLRSASLRSKRGRSSRRS